MSSLSDPKRMRGGDQVSLFADNEPEPATTAGPAPADEPHADQDDPQADTQGVTQ